MFVLRRSLLVSPENGQSIAECYDELRLRLAGEVQRSLALPDTPAEWPNGTWKNEHLSVSCSEWSAGIENTQRLFQLEVQRRLNSYAWEASLNLASDDDEAIAVWEEWRLSTYKDPIPFHEMPEWFSFFGERTCKDEDGMFANSTYLVSAGRVVKFVDFLCSPSRRVPIVLLSPSISDGEYSIQNAAAFARRVRGLAHVIKLQDQAEVQHFGHLLPNYRCYDGAVRIYWPGFQRTGRTQDTPYWLRRWMEKRGEEHLQQVIFERVARESLRLASRSEKVRYLETVRHEHLRVQSERLRRKAIDQAKLRLKAEQEAEDFIQLYEALEQERNDLLHQKAELEQEVNRLNNEVRKLRWALNSTWQSRDTQSSEDGKSPALFLSNKALKRYEMFDPNEREYWDQHIFSKLLNEELRQKQSEAIPNGKGTHWVFPRSGTGGGRRLIYYSDELNVYVCELFTGSEHDSRYMEARNSGFDREEYGGFQPWVPLFMNWM